MSEQTAAAQPIRQRLFVRGIVQGVGFRPFVYGLARQHQLSGFVGNNSSGVFIEIEGDTESVVKFRQELTKTPPPLAHIEDITINDIPLQHSHDFVIVVSQAQDGASTLISPDLCVCDDCLHEMQDPTDRRHHYPFINCTNCGPRFTIIKDVPYDRPLTTMVDFPMCAACLVEYHDPLDRRFHAQPNACPECGPQVQFVASDGTQSQRDTALEAAIAALHTGQIVAVKGLGGFHLACDAQNEAAIHILRKRKGRPSKPFAIMVPSLDAARDIAEIDESEARLLSSRERPIVLLKKKVGILPESIAPGNQFVGVMLPYTPLHDMLVQRPLVMTSGNYSHEPIIKDNDDALQKLRPLADGFLLHNRDIHVHCDDSVVRVFDGAAYPIRRSRGYAPFPVKLPFDVPPLLAVGGERKSTFCLTKNNHAFMSQHIGDMENLETLQAFERAYEHMRAIFRIEPHAIVCDMHPTYLSSQWAKRYATTKGLPVLEVQHHHAHIAAVMAEHQLQEPVIGFSYDGTGYGDDGNIWGGEVFIADYRSYERVSHLPYMPIAGGDTSVKNPYRLALSYLWACGIAWDEALPPVQFASVQEKRILQQQLERNLNVVQTSSMGRFFDAVAALIGIRQQIGYEAQAAIELETLAADVEDSYSFENFHGFFNELLNDLKNMTSIAKIAGKFHNMIAANILTLSIRLRATYGISKIALSGGVFQNITLLEKTIRLLHANQFEAFTHRRVPANDGGLALGQAIIASQLL